MIADKLSLGFYFLSYPGLATDGRLFVYQAINAGAAALVYEPENWPSMHPIPSELPAIPLPGLATKLAEIASRFYGEPTKK